MLCREPDGHWVQAGIISFASNCAQEDTPVLLTDMAAHSSWLQARAQGAAFLAQNPETLEISDEDSCVGMNRGCEEWDVWGHPGLHENSWAAGGSHSETNFSSEYRIDTGHPYTVRG